MKIINKSTSASPDVTEDFYIILEHSTDLWENSRFFCDEGEKFYTQEDAEMAAVVGTFVAKVTLVAKIV
jgi:hypothetical protein